MAAGKTHETIMIFQKPELYFFPYYKGIVFSPFGVKERGILYWIYKVLHILRIPVRSVFWGEWKRYIKTAKNVIIFDYGYQRGMETYIHKINPACNVYLFYWNIITPYRINYKIFTDKELIYSTDMDDCRTYHMKYNTMFYCRQYYRPYQKMDKDTVFFLGVDKGRSELLLQIKRMLERVGITCDIRLIAAFQRQSDRERFADILTETRLSYTEYLAEIEKSSILLDVVQDGQTAPTMRVMEAIYLSKKLITNNHSLMSCDFYNENNIFVLPEELNDSVIEQVKAFLELPFEPYSDEILKKYDWKEWKNRFQK